MVEIYGDTQSGRWIGWGKIGGGGQVGERHIPRKHPVAKTVLNKVSDNLSDCSVLNTDHQTPTRRLLGRHNSRLETGLYQDPAARSDLPTDCPDILDILRIDEQEIIA